MSSLSTVDERVEAINHKLRTQLFRKGSKGLKAIARTFKIADFNGSGSLDVDEFEEALNYAGLFLAKSELSTLFGYYDSGGDGTISYNEFVAGMAPPLSQRRVAMVAKVFKMMDRDQSEVIEGNDVAQLYNAKKHPDVLKGDKTEAEVLAEFLKGFEGQRGNRDGKISWAEWQGYYRDLSASIPSDDYFITMMQSVWQVREDGVPDAQSKRVDQLLLILEEKVRQKTRAGEDEKTTLKRSFQHFDRDESGAVTKNEFQATLRNFGICLENKDVTSFFDRFDPDKSGAITYKEFSSYLFSEGK